MAEAAEAAKPAKGRLLGMLVLGAVALAAAAAGFAVPVFLLGGAPKQEAHDPKPVTHDTRIAVIPFDSVAVNLSSDRLTRYLRVKLALVVDEAHEHDVSEKIKRKQAFLKSWLISHLADQTIPDVTGAAGVNRIRREVQDQFNAMLFPDGPEMIRDVLFEEFLIQ